METYIFIAFCLTIVAVAYFQTRALDKPKKV